MKVVESVLKFLGNYALFLICFPIGLGLFVLVNTVAFYVYAPIIILGFIGLFLWYTWDFVKFIGAAIKEIYIGIKNKANSH